METLDIIYLSITIISVVFSVYLYFRNPQVSSEKKDALLAQKVEYESQSNKRQFLEMGERIEKAFTLAKNDVSHVDAKVDVMIQSQNAHYLDMAVRMGKLETLMEERLPKKIV